MSDEAVEENARDRLKRLMKERDAMEAELKENVEMLMQTPAGLDGPLKDAEGFPRADCDLHMVTRRRGRVACLRNDLKAVMEDIKATLEAVHEEGAAAGEQKEDAEEPTEEDPLVERYRAYPEFLVVDSVLPDSPAAESGLRQSDKIISWNGVTKQQPDFMGMIASITARYENKAMNIIVGRGGLSVQKVVLTPKKWSGRGLLGCVLNKIKE
eukprot:TRINITY_DN34366_c0_g1_i1.p1 TRINITY_DN34366_c0_g1~~TRINITY_DN34366_c0_g1_i1.p1  ORF type:complete len:223 (+),score=81.18 TRINITY_DN34366_c0_g1_i1:35-670(+)